MIRPAQDRNVFREPEKSASRGKPGGLLGPETGRLERVDHVETGRVPRGGLSDLANAGFVDVSEIFASSFLTNDFIIYFSCRNIMIACQVDI